MDLKIEIEINKNLQKHLSVISQLIIEGWVIHSINEAEKDRANANMLFVLVREFN